jgi:hypothetical protein
MANRSLSALLEFLVYLEKKGIMSRNTAGGRRAACGKILGILEPEEQSDVTSIDLKAVMGRFVNLEGKNYTPSSLGVYQSRVSSALADFNSYLADPMSFKPSSVQKKNPVENQKKSTGNKPHKTKTVMPVTIPRQEINIPSSANVFPIPIRADVVVRIHGLPFDLTTDEAEKISSVIKAMAMVSK